MFTSQAVTGFKMLLASHLDMSAPAACVRGGAGKIMFIKNPSG